MPDLAKPVTPPTLYRIGMVTICDKCEDIITLAGDLPGTTYWSHMRSGSVQCRARNLPANQLTRYQQQMLGTVKPPLPNRSVARTV